jgi:N-acetylmuramoyl-L-alanine amidase
MFLEKLPCFILLAACVASAQQSWRGLSRVEQCLGVTNCCWDGDTLTVSNSSDCVKFFAGRRRAEVNGVTVWMNVLPEGNPADGTWKMAAVDYDFLCLSLLATNAPVKASGLRILIDPGHGGEDDGALSGPPQFSEKDFTLDIARKLGERLGHTGFDVVYTRTNDVAVPLSDRSRMARTRGADLFVSIHANHASNSSACGFETYVLPPCGHTGTSEGSRLCAWQTGNRNDFQSTLLGFCVQSSLCRTQTNRVDRGLKRQSYYVLRETPCPSVLIELGFLSNRGEAADMRREDWKAAQADAVADGIAEYARRLSPLSDAVARKRAADEKANAAWRAKLAAKASSPPIPEKTVAQTKSSLPKPPELASNVSPKAAPAHLAPVALAAPFPAAPFPEPPLAVRPETVETADEPVMPAPLDFNAVEIERDTNTAPVVFEWSRFFPGS